jgi:multidrug resistance efflux pump
MSDLVARLREVSSGDPLCVLTDEAADALKAAEARLESEQAHSAQLFERQMAAVKRAEAAEARAEKAEQKYLALLDQIGWTRPETQNPDTAKP